MSEKILLNRTFDLFEAAALVEFLGTPAILTNKDNGAAELKLPVGSSADTVGEIRALLREKNFLLEETEKE